MISFAQIVVEPIGVAIVATLVWWFVNRSQGWLEKQPWPLSDQVACVAIAAGLTFVSTLFRWWRSRRHVEGLAAEAAVLGLHYHENVTLDDLGGAAQLRLFSQWHNGWNRLSGQYDGLPLEMMDFTSRQRAHSRRGSRATYRHETVVVIPLEAVDWPVFEMMPRGIATWLWDLAGAGAARFRFAEESQLVSASDQATLQKFNRKYCVFVGLAQRVAGLAGMDTGISVGNVPEDPGQVRDRFSLSAMRRLAQTSGWRIECNATHTAFWKASRIVAADQRESLLTEVTQLYRCLAEPVEASEHANVQIHVESADGSILGPRILGMLAGAAVGMLLAVAVCLPLMFLLPHDVLRYAIFAWPILGLASVLGCAVLGANISDGFG